VPSGRTEEEADEKQQYLTAHALIVAREILSTILETSIFPAIRWTARCRNWRPPRFRARAFSPHHGYCPARHLTLRQTAQVVAGARQVPVLRGTPQHIADVMEEWFLTEACDGFQRDAAVPARGRTTSSPVIPKLQRRGLFRPK
jgi:alkanesulfonate monooxygenase SsuD/methylene tetrahydromethanopterin reductase-like flavin-dependent oxidoreductase (luciferase family)